MIPVAEHAQALKVGALRIHLCGGKGAARGAKAGGVQLLARPAEFLLHRQLDRQAVAVPARDIGRVAPIE